MASAVRFHFDPVCPWCWITAKWVWRLEDLGAVQPSWAVFSLEIANQNSDEARTKGHARSALALRTVVAVREGLGSAAVGRFYAALGRRFHEQGAPLEQLDTVSGALVDAGLDASLAERADGDEELWQQVAAEHTALVDRTRSFGVPTIVLDDGAGPAIFGPVIGREPSDEDALELWEHISWLARYENFSELKRGRSVAPEQLASWRRR